MTFFQPEEIAALGRGEFSRDCLQMELVRTSGPEPKRFAGPGYFRQTADRRLEFAIYATESPTVDAIFEDALNGTPGILIPQDDYYTLRATDWVGTIWESTGVVPDPSSGPGGTVVRGKLNSIQCSDMRAASKTFHGFVGRIFGDFDLPANVKTVRQESIDGRETKSFALRGLKVQSLGAHFLLMPEPGVLRVGVEADRAFPEHFATRVLETLQFVLARPLAWDVIETATDGERRTVIGGRPAAVLGRHTWTPLNIVQSRDQLGTLAFCKLFDEYLRHIAQSAEDQWHPLTRDLNAVALASAAGLESHVLVLSVAVEGVLRHSFPLAGQPSTTEIAEIDALLGQLEGIEVPTQLRARLRGALGEMKRARASDRLRDLVDEGMVGNASVEAWRRLRNASAHGDDLLRMPLQEVLDLRGRVLGLLHKLVFSAIGYRGLYTDYSVPGWPRSNYQATET